MQKLYKIQCCNRQIFERFILIYEKMFHYASAAYATLEALCFALSVIILRRPNFCQSNAEYIFVLLCNNNAWIMMKFAGGSHHHEHSK